MEIPKFVLWLSSWDLRLVMGRGSRGRGGARWTDRVREVGHGLDVQQLLEDEVQLLIRALTWELSKCHSEQGIRTPLGEQGHSLNKLLLQLMDSCRLWLWPRETVELGVSVLEGPVVFHMAEGPFIQQHLADPHSLAPGMDPKPHGQDPIHQLPARAALPIEPKMVLSVSDEVWASGQQMSMQLLPSLEHSLHGGLFQAHAEIQGLLTVSQWRPAKPLDAAGALVFKPQLVGAASGPVHPPQHHVEQLPLWHDIGEATHWWCSQS